MVKIIKVETTLQFFGLGRTGDKIEIIKGLPDDAKLIHMEFLPMRQCFVFYYESEEGIEIGEPVLLDKAEIYHLGFRRLE